MTPMRTITIVDKNKPYTFKIGLPSKLKFDESQRKDIGFLVMQGMDIIETKENMIGEDWLKYCAKVAANSLTAKGVKKAIIYDLGADLEAKEEETKEARQPLDFDEEKEIGEYINSYHGEIFERYDNETINWLEQFGELIQELEGKISINLFMMYYAIRGEIPLAFPAMASYGRLFVELWKNNNYVLRIEEINTYLDTSPLAEEYFSHGRVPPDLPLDEYRGLDAQSIFRAWRKRKGVGKVKCMECGEEFWEITPNHLKKHNMTLEDYYQRYGATIT